MITLQQVTGKRTRLINKAPDGKEIIIEGFLEQGVVSYMDSDAGICYLSNEAINRMLPSLIGVPVCIDHQDISKENAGDQAKGKVTRAWWNEKTGRFDCAITYDSEVEEKANAGWSASCAYSVSEVGPGGEWHAIPYHESIENGEFEHMAIVENPRYEDCSIRMNSKDAKMINAKGRWKVTTQSSSGAKHEVEIEAGTEEQARKQAESGGTKVVSIQKVGDGTQDFENDKHAEMFAKEKKEHPEFSDEDIEKIVQDHLKENARAGKVQLNDGTWVLIKRAFRDRVEGGMLYTVEDVQTGREFEVAEDSMKKQNTITLKNVIIDGVDLSKKTTKELYDIAAKLAEAQRTSSGGLFDKNQKEWLKAIEKELASRNNGKIPLRNAKIVDFGNFEMDVRWQIYSDNSWQIKWSDGSSVGGTAQNLSQAHKDVKDAYKDQKDNSKITRGQLQNKNITLRKSSKT